MKIGSDHDDVIGKFESRITSLANNGRVGLGIAWFKRQILTVQSIVSEFLRGDRRVDQKKRLRRGDAKFAWIAPPPQLMRFQNALQRAAGRCTAQPSDSLYGFYSGKAGSFVIFDETKELGNAFGAARHTHLIDR